MTRFTRTAALPLAIVVTSLASLALAPAARAEILVGLPTAATDATTAVQRPHVRLVVALSNPGTTEAALDLPKGLLEVGAPAASRVPVAWTRQDGQAEGAPEIALTGKLALAPGANVRLIGRAELPRPGRYLLTVTSGAAVHGPFAIAWDLPAVSKDLMPDSLTGQGLSHWPSSVASRAVLAVPVSNDGALPIARPDFALGTVTLAGSGTGALLQSLDLAQEIPTETNCPALIPPGGRCKVVVGIEGQLRPGNYSFDLTATGGGGSDRAALTLAVKASAWWAAGLVMAGVVLGALLSGWQASGRANSVKLVPWFDLLDRLRPLTKTDQDASTAAAARRAIDRVNVFVDSTRLAMDRPEPDLAAAQKEAAALEQVAKHLPVLRLTANNNPALKEALNALDLALAADPIDLTVLEAAWAKARDAAKEPAQSAATGGALGVVPFNLRLDGGTQVNIPGFVFLPDASATGAQVRRRIRAMDLGSTALLALLTGLAAIPVWGTAPTWGAGLDFLTAFLAGVALRFALPVVSKTVNGQS